MATPVSRGALALAGASRSDRAPAGTYRARLPMRAMLGTYLFVIWATFITADPISFGGIPLKLFLLALALAMWFPHRSRGPIPLAIPVIAVAVVVPIVWAVVASYHFHPYAGQDPSPTAMTAEHASRFLYLLIYLPIADAILHANVGPATRMWLVPVVLLCGLTWVLYVLYVKLGVNIGVEITRGGPGKVGPLLGVVTPPGFTPVRIFFANHILIVPAVAALIGWSLACKGSRIQWPLIAALGFTVVTLYPIHTRGLTIAVLVVLAAVASLSWQIGSAWPAALLAVSVVVLLTTSFDTRAAAFLTGDRSDQSSRDRVVQGPQLIAAFKDRPLLGSGLGATLQSGYYRSPTEPYQFELNYHQILFQNGIVGLAVILGLPLLAMARAVLAMKRLPREESALAIGGVAGVAGLLMAGASNPYLISSYGMLALAVMLALCARAVHLAARTA